MKLLPLDSSNRSRSTSRYRQSPVSNAVAALVFLSISLCLVAWHLVGDLPMIILVLSGGCCALFSSLCFANFKKSLSPDNWIVSLSPDHIQIKFRSYLNGHFPADDPQVAAFELTEILSANITKQTRSTPSSNNRKSTSFHTFLDLKVSGDLLSLKQQLNYERSLKGTKQGRIGTSSHRALHEPVTVIKPQTVRIEWRSPNDRVIPGIKVAIKQLSRLGVTIGPLKRENLD
jgi:hypothetical protein